MKGDWIRIFVFLLVSSLGIISCSSSTNVAEGGIGGTGISMGSVSAVGSIWVNGVEYDTTGANIIFADDGSQYTDTNGSAGDTTVFPGMVVTVEGTVNADRVSGTATSVTYADSLEGPIEVAPAGNTFVVMAQTVIVDNLTKFRDVAPADISGLAANDVVEVSGFVDANGKIRATYIEKTASNVLEIKGKIGSASQYAFMIGSLSVNTSGIGLDVSGLQGQFVEVKGSSYANGVLIADSVEVRSSALNAKDYDEAKMEGIVIEVLSSSEFTLGGQLVRYDRNTEFDGGLATNIQSGVKLEVEGELTGGVLIAKEISFEDNIEIEGDVTALGAGTLSLVGLSGITINVDEALTELAGDDTQFADIHVGHHLKIRGREYGVNSVLATHVESSAVGGQDTVLQGPLQFFSYIQVLGVTVDTTGLTFEMEGFANPVSATTFFNTINLNDLMELKGSWNNGLLTWESIELDN